MSEGVEILEEAAVVKKDEPKEEVKPEAEATEKPSKKTKKAAKAASKSPSKRYQTASKGIERRPYSLDETISLVKKAATAKFDETIEAHFRLGIDPSQTAQMVRGSVQLPHGTGKKVKVLVFAAGTDAEEAKKLGATVATEEIIAQIEKGSIPFDLVLATPSEMPKIAKLARVLGVRGLMPNPKAGTITTDLAGTIGARSQGLIDFKNENALLHIALGKASFTEAQLKENFLAIFQAVKAARPAKISGEYLKSVTIASTMGPGVKLNLDELR